MNGPCAWLPLLVATTFPAAAETVFHVSPTGRDTNPGTTEQPFASLERARQAVRAAGTADARRVIAQAGSYPRETTFTLGPEDAGTAAAHVVWQAAPGATVRLLGARSLAPSAFSPVTNGAVLARLRPEAQGRVVEADLRALGVTNLPTFPRAYHGVPPGPELVFNDTRLVLARWPNEGWATIARIVEAGSRPCDGDQRRLPGSFEYSGDRPGTGLPWPPRMSIASCRAIPRRAGIGR